MKITRPNTFAITDPNTKRFIEDQYKLVNKNISFGHQVQILNNKIVNPNADQNLDGASCEISNTGAANTTFPVTHYLGRVPLFYDVKYINGNGVVSSASTAWTTTTAYFQCSLASAHIRLFIH